MNAAMFVDGKKYMWDGEEFAGDAAADAAMETYNGQGFETMKIEEGGVSFLFTRRVVTDVKVEGS